MELSNAMWIALKDCAETNRRGFGYGFKPKTAEKLAQIGLMDAAVVWTVKGPKTVYWINAEGRRAIAGTETGTQGEG